MRIRGHHCEYNDPNQLVVNHEQTQTTPNITITLCRTQLNHHTLESLFWVLSNSQSGWRHSCVGRAMHPSYMTLPPKVPAKG